MSDQSAPGSSSTPPSTGTIKATAIPGTLLDTAPFVWDASPETPAELNTLLDKMMPHSHRPHIEGCGCSCCAARSALLALYDRQREELNAAIKERKFAARSAILLDDQFKQVCDELESDRSQLERSEQNLADAYALIRMRATPVPECTHKHFCLCENPASPVPAPEDTPDAEKLAAQFHEAYERLAPSFGYETREASAKPWADVPENNRRLMTAVCAEILGGLRSQVERTKADQLGEVEARAIVQGWNSPVFTKDHRKIYDSALTKLRRLSSDNPQ